MDENTKKLVWNNARTMKGYDPDNIRIDPCGAIILWTHYGLRTSEYGWEIDHVFPVDLGGDDNILNLRAMQWENNLSKGNDYPSYVSVVTALGNNNIRKTKSFNINKDLQEKINKLYNLKL